MSRELGLRVGAGRSASLGLPVMTFAIRNTNSDTPRNVMPPTDRFGSSSGRRIIDGSSSSRTMNSR